MSIQVAQASIIYQNVVTMITDYRKQNITNTPLKKGLNEDMNSRDLIHIVADGRPEVGVCNYLFLPPNSNLFMKLGALDNELNKIKTQKGDKSVYVIVPDDHDQYVTKSLNAVKSEFKHSAVYKYRTFKIVVPRHAASCLHEIATQEDIDLLNSRFISTKSMPQINEDDPQAIWIGLKEGEICKIHRQSATAGLSIVYRVCIVPLVLKKRSKKK